MHFIFQYDYINLEYLDLQNNNITNKGIKSLQNNSLVNIKYNKSLYYKIFLSS